MRIFVTGGASGLGGHITRKLASNKKNFVYFSYFKSRKQANEIETKFNNTLAIKCDFTKQKEVETLAKKIGHYKIEALINNALTGLDTNHFHKLSASVFTKRFNFDILPAIRITREAIKYFRKNNFGRIVTILTSSLENPPIGWSAYIASKSYLASLAKSWANENSRFNITSNCVSPGIMNTGLINSKLIRPDKFLNPDKVAKVIQIILQSNINGKNKLIK